MIQYYSFLNNDMIEHARSEYPNESCGVITENKYIPCENVAIDKKNNFKITDRYILNLLINKKLQVIIHSHVDEIDSHGNKTDYGHASSDDMKRQLSHKTPYGVVHLNSDGAFMKIFFWGDELPVQSLKGRPFIHGVYDCYGTVRDYYRSILNITLPQYPRSFGWWNFKENSSLLLDYVKDAGFYEVPLNKVEKHDVIFMTVMSHTVNHCAVYIGGGLILHHLYKRLSGEQPICNFNDIIYSAYRYEGLKC